MTNLTLAAKEFVLSTQQKRNFKWIQVNDDEERKGGQAGRGTWRPGGIQTGLTNDWEQ